MTLVPLGASVTPLERLNAALPANPDNDSPLTAAARAVVAERTAPKGWFARRRQDAEERIIVALWALSPYGEPSGSYGLDVMRTARLKLGRFTPAMDRLVEAGLVEASWVGSGQEGRPRRRMYRPTPESQ